ncbi:MAG TPA: hypothetical protein VJ964_12265, partial [Balneolaceae bacterium]|nr:hypothetical protein [Balneolaceae bacterium]
MNFPISRWFKISLTAGSVLLLFSACGSKQAGNDQMNGAASDQNNFRSDTATVQTTKVQPHNFSREITSTGNLVAKQHAQLRTLVPGKI